MDEQLDYQSEGFTITTAEKADWAVQKIKEAEQRCALFVEVCKADIAKKEQQIKDMQDKTDRETTFLKNCLSIYLDTVPAKKTKTQESLELPSGKIVRKFGKIVLKQKPELLDYRKKYYGGYVMQKESVNWAEAKKLFSVQDQYVINESTGEVVDVVDMQYVNSEVVIK